MAVVFIMALLPRVFLYYEAMETPLMPPVFNSQTDMYFYDSWARKIAAGDWLSKDPPRFYYSWSEKVARDYFRHKPSDLARLAPLSKETGLSPEELIWEEWLGGSSRLPYEPLYSYMVAIIYAIFGAQHLYVYALQVILGAAACALVFNATNTMFGYRAAVCAATLAVLNGTLAWSDIHLLRTTLTVFMVALALSAIVSAQDNPTWPRWAIAGFCFGVGAMTQSYFLVAGLCCWIWWTWRHRANLKSTLHCGAGFLLGFAICLAPLVFRNAVAGAPLFSMLARREFFFIIANAPDLDPFVIYNLLSPYIGAIMAQTGGDPLATVMVTIQSHGGALNYIIFMLAKAAALVAPYPANDNGMEYSYYYLHSISLKLAPVHFSIIFPLAIAGAFSEGRTARAVPLYIMAGVFLSTMIVFFTMARYRAPLEVVLIPLAGAALAHLLDSYGTRKTGAILVGGFTAFVILLPPAMAPTEFAYKFPASLYYQPSIDKAIAEKQYMEAAGIFDDMFLYENNYGIKPGAISPPQFKIAKWYAMLLLEQAEAYRLAGRPGEELMSREKAKTILLELDDRGFINLKMNSSPAAESSESFGERGPIQPEAPDVPSSGNP